MSVPGKEEEKRESGGQWIKYPLLKSIYKQRQRRKQKQENKFSDWKLTFYI